MSDLPQGEGWWQASDGLWYSPEQHPDHRPSAEPAPAPTRTSSAGLFDAIPPGAARSGDSGDTGAVEDPPRGWFSRWGKWAVLGAALVGVLGLAATMIGGDGGGDDGNAATEVASATTIRTPPESTVPTTTPSTTVATTTTTTTPTPATLRPQVTISLSGTGDAVEVLETPNTDAYIATLTHAGDGNFVVSAIDPAGDQVDLLVNQVGDYRGQAPVNFLVGDQFSLLEVKANGPWTMELEPLLRWASRAEVSAGIETGEAYSGAGDRLFTFVPEGARVVRFACGDCDSNVVVDAYGAGREGLVNELGPYQGEFLVPADTLVIHVQAQNRAGTGGNWTWEVSEAP